MARYEPIVSCIGHQDARKKADPALQKLLDRISASKDRQKFGPEGEPGVQVVLPWTHTEGKSDYCIAPPAIRLLRTAVSLTWASFRATSCENNSRCRASHCRHFKLV